MTAITYGSSVKETAKTRRHARRRAAAIERDGICSIIDTVFGIEPEVVAATARPTNRVSRATSYPSLRDRHEEILLTVGSQYQKVGNEAGRQIHAVQKMRGKSIPLI